MLKSRAATWIHTLSLLNLKVVLCEVFKTFFKLTWFVNFTTGV